FGDTIVPRASGSSFLLKAFRADLDGTSRGRFEIRIEPRRLSVVLGDGGWWARAQRSQSVPAGRAGSSPVYQGPGLCTFVGGAVTFAKERWLGLTGLVIPVAGNGASATVALQA
ncbi:MAG: hypothetical protein ABSG62_09315, partial [Terracidiphilus sp.]